jgi:phosphatidylserine/phosphatidylglycerophosphate/cardiolipin synthase-like enzyme
MAVPAFDVHFGGPDLPAGILRNVLARHVDAVPAGGSIDWVTYYFRDRRLAAALVAARARGVAVRVTLDGRPRTPQANDAVISLLQAGLGDGLRVVRHPMDFAPWGKLVRARLHEKLYCFSHPEPIALIGSFNPSGDEPELEPAMLRAVGDQDRGHNLLVGLRDPVLVDGLVAHARELHRRRHGAFDRFRMSANRRLAGGGVSVHFMPRVLPDPVLAALRRCGAGHRVRIAASHLSGPTSLAILKALTARGASVEILAEETARRVPAAIETRLGALGARFQRVSDPQGLPMHAKFTLIEGPQLRHSIFGSFNWTEPSRLFNREIAAISDDPDLFDGLAARWDVLQRIAGATGD